MIDKELYCKTFSRLCASEKAKKEVFQMTQEKRRSGRLPKALRAGTIAAAMTLALAVAAGAADLATGGTFLQSLRQIWSDGYETCYEGVTQDGSEIQLSVTQGARIETRDGGETVVLCAAGEEVDITEALNKEGTYHFEKALAERNVTVDVTGTPEDWELTETVTEADGITYTTHASSGDADPGVRNTTVLVTETAEETDEKGVTHSREVTVTSSQEVTVTGDPDQERP